MFLTTARLSFIASGTHLKSLPTSTTSALSTATSVPAPIAIPTSALTRAGASFMPSPTITVFLPDSFKSRIFFSFRSGRTPATTSSTPTSFATALAVISLSPVSITIPSPARLRSDTASRAFSLTVSATAITPSVLPSVPTISGVFPSSANFCTASPQAALFAPYFSAKAALPTKTFLPPTEPSIPIPKTATNSSASAIPNPRSAHSSITAEASGCSLFFSNAPASASTSSSVAPNAATSVTDGFPSVIVPVLSITTVSTERNVSNASPDLTSIPFSAPLPVPTIIATGVASPSAHGQEMTSTDIPLAIANSNP